MTSDSSCALTYVVTCPQYGFNGVGARVCSAVDGILLGSVVDSETGEVASPVSGPRM